MIVHSRHVYMGSPPFGASKYTSLTYQGVKNSICEIKQLMSWCIKCSHTILQLLDTSNQGVVVIYIFIHGQTRSGVTKNFYKIQQTTYQLSNDIISLAQNMNDINLDLNKEVIIQEADSIYIIYIYI